MKKLAIILLAIALVAAMSVTAFATNFVNSIEVKPAPQIIEIVIDGVPYGSVVIESTTGKTIKGVPLFKKGTGTSLLEFFVISAVEKSSAIVPDIATALDNAEKDLKNAENLGKLDPEMEKKLNDAIDEFYGDSQRKANIEDLVVSDLFDAALIRDQAQIEQIQEGEKCTFIFKPNFTNKDFFALLQNTGDGKWDVVKDVVWTEEGYLKVTVSELSAFALVVEKTADLPVNPDGPNAPQTDLGTGFRAEYAVVAVAFIAIAVFFLVKGKKKTGAK